MDRMGHSGLRPLKYSIIGSYNVANSSARLCDGKRRDWEMWGENPGAAEPMAASSLQPCRGKHFHRRDSTEDKGKDRNCRLETLNVIT